MGYNGSPPSNPITSFVFLIYNFALSCCMIPWRSWSNVNASGTLCVKPGCFAASAEKPDVSLPLFPQPSLPCCHGAWFPFYFWTMDHCFLFQRSTSISSPYDHRLQLLDRKVAALHWFRGAVLFVFFSDLQNFMFFQISVLNKFLAVFFFFLSKFQQKQINFVRFWSGFLLEIWSSSSVFFSELPVLDC